MQGAGASVGRRVDFTLSGDQMMLKALVERFVRDRAPAADSAANWALLASLGVLALPFAEASGGLGGGAVEIITAMEALGRGLAREPVLNRIIVAGLLLEAAGTPAQRADWLPRVIGGTAHLAFAYAEHGTRFALHGGATILDHRGLCGAKTCVPGGADAFIVTAEGPHGVALALLRADAPGLARRDYRLVDGSLASELAFAEAPAEPMAGDCAALAEVVLTARIAACAELVGLMDLILQTTLDYVRQRRQFGAPIGSFQAVQHRLADVYVSYELARSHLYRSVLTEPRGAAVAAAKAYISEAAIHLGEECIQFHGGMGVSDDVVIGHAHKRILVLASAFGDVDTELSTYNHEMAP